jgi:cystathionine beta-synthase
MWHKNILETIGQTPLVQLNSITSAVKCTILAKVEYFNPGNSVKDRIGVQMIDDAERKGLLKPGGTIIEGTSGNTGMGLALVAAVKGYRCVFTVTDKQSPEKVAILRAVGAEVIVCPTNVEPEDPQSYYSVAKRLTKEIPNSFYPNQYDNLSNTQAHYLTTGPELWAQTEGKITHFVAGMGTCGTIVGCSKYLKEQKPDVQVIGADTYGSLFKKLKDTGEIDLNEVYPYLTEGIGEDFIPANCDMNYVDRILKVADKDAAITARRLARLEGLFVGWSCGTAMWAALEVARDLGKNDLLVVLLPDHGSRYLGKVYNDTWMKERSWLEEGTLLSAGEIVRRKGTVKLESFSPHDKIQDAMLRMRSMNISQIPVIEGAHVVGSISESQLLNALIDDPSIREASIGQVMNDPFPFVLPGTRMDAITKMITRENSAVMVQMEDGSLDIITKHDLLSVLAG